MSLSNLTKLEEKAIKLLLKHHTKGLLQSELWNKLGVSSREGSRIAIKLEKRGIIKRERVYANERWTRKLVPLIKQFDIKPLLGAPCPTCPYNDNCGYQKTYNPMVCPLIERWITSAGENGAADTNAILLQNE
ncbi:MAG: hypothetical protein NZ920_04890 [Aigarchaeota archaeon]|nr:hypothetical protein [Aigarchaeota archaeon]MDW8093274.1 hypothetical protein [Nitrososphaerota archaeon]